MTSKQIKKLSLERLSMCWVEAEFIYIILIGIFAFIILLANFLLELFTSDKYVLSPKDFIIQPKGIIVLAAAAIFLYLIYAPIYFGLKWCFFNASKGNITPVNCLFSCCGSLSRWLKAIRLKFITDVSKGIVIIPMTAAFGAEIYLYLKITEFTESTVLKALMIIFMIISFICMHSAYLLYSSRFTIVPYLFTMDPDSSVKEIFKKGTAVSDKNKMSLFRLSLSFVPYFLCCILGFPVFFVFPLYSMSFSIVADMICSGNDISIDGKESNSEEKIRQTTGVTNAEKT